VTDIDDRAAGVLLAAACGDALGAGYEFGPPLPSDQPVFMCGGNGFQPGEWTDDTSMAVIIAQAAVRHGLTNPAGMDAVAEGFLRWLHDGPVDIGVQTSAVLSSAAGPTAAALTASAQSYFEGHHRSGTGNGALMRTAPIALSTLDDDEETAAQVAFAVSGLTHADPTSGEACTLWTLAIRHAVLHGTFDGVRLALRHLDADRAAYWSRLLDDAEARRPGTFEHNGWVVEALQAAWSAITTTAVPAEAPQRHLLLALENAVRGGRDADTVAAIAGGLLGARWGASAIPAEWLDQIRGYPGYNADDLRALTQGLLA
jgi:ADP-ribosylglycohydrolase